MHLVYMCFIAFMCNCSYDDLKMTRHHIELDRFGQVGVAYMSGCGLLDLVT